MFLKYKIIFFIIIYFPIFVLAAEEPAEKSVKPVGVPSSFFPDDYDWAVEKVAWKPLAPFGNFWNYYFCRDIVPKRQVWGKQALLPQQADGNSSGIPKNIHHFWTTDTPIPQSFIDGLKAEVSDLRGTQIILWCVHTDTRQNFQKKMEKELGAGHFKIEDVSSIWAMPPGAEALYKRLHRAGRYSDCQLMLGAKVLYHHGGLFTRNGVWLNQMPQELLAFDFFAPLNGFHLNTDLWGCCPHFSGVKAYLDYLAILPHTMDWPTRRDHKDALHHLCGDVGFTFHVERHTLPEASMALLPAGKMQAYLKPADHTAAFEEKLPSPDVYFPKKFFLGRDIVQNWVKGTLTNTDGSKSKKFAHVLFGMTWDEITAQRQKSIAHTRKSLLGFGAPILEIPHTSHQTWLTSETDPRQIPKTHIEATVARWKQLGPGWTHILWVQSSASLAPSLGTIQEAWPEVEIREIDTYFLKRGEKKESAPGKKTMRLRCYFDEFIRLRTYVTAADMLRKDTLYDEGGVYFDMSTTLLENITPLVDRADGIFYGNPEVQVFDTTILGAPPGDVALGRYFDVFDRLHTFSDLKKGAGLGDYIALVGQAFYNVCYSVDCEKRVTIPLIRGLMVDNPHHFGSWKGNSKDTLGTTSFNTAMSKKSLFKISEMSS